MATHTHALGGITRTFDDAVVPVLVDAGRPIDDAGEAFKAATAVVLAKGLKGTLTAAEVVTWAALVSVTVTA